MFVFLLSTSGFRNFSLGSKLEHMVSKGERVQTILSNHPMYLLRLTFIFIFTFSSHVVVPGSMEKFSHFTGGGTRGLELVRKLCMTKLSSKNFRGCQVVQFISKSCVECWNIAQKDSAHLHHRFVLQKIVGLKCFLEWWTIYLGGWVESDT